MNNDNVVNNANDINDVTVNDIDIIPVQTRAGRIIKPPRKLDL